MHPFNRRFKRAFLARLDLGITDIASGYEAMCAALKVFAFVPRFEAFEHDIRLLVDFLRKIRVDLAAVDQKWRGGSGNVFLENSGQ